MDPWGEREEEEREIGRENERQADPTPESYILADHVGRENPESDRRLFVHSPVLIRNSSFVRTHKHTPFLEKTEGGWSFYGYLTDWRAVFFFFFLFFLSSPV